MIMIIDTVIAIVVVVVDTFIIYRYSRIYEIDISLHQSLVPRQRVWPLEVTGITTPVTGNPCFTETLKECNMETNERTGDRVDETERD